MDDLPKLSPERLASLLTWISENYDFPVDPASLSKSKMIEILNHLPTDVIEDALDNFKTVQGNPIRVTRMTSEMMISEGSKEHEDEDQHYDQADLSEDEELIACADCGEEFILLDSEADEVDCPECGSHLFLSSRETDEEEMDEDDYSDEEEE